MQYHLDTIPVWEAMEAHSDCPLCYIRQTTEADEIERTLGGSVMEPDARIRVNERGFCQEHQRQLYALQNRLGQALLMDSHAKEVLKKLDKLESAGGKTGLFAGKSGLAAQTATALQELCQRCAVCEALETHMERYLNTFLHLWKTDAKFQEEWAHSKGVCLPHAVELLNSASRQLNVARQKEFTASLLGLLRRQLATEEKELEWFTLKFDYRNQDKPWGNSRNALPRTVNRLRGRCLDENGEGKKQQP